MLLPERNGIIRTLTFALFLVSAIAAPTIAQHVPTEDEVKLIRMTYKLQQSPLSDSDNQMRTWLIGWVSASPDIIVKVCDVLDLTHAPKTPYAPMILVQTIFANAAFQITHPDQKNDLVATQMAGMDSALSTYEAILAKRSDARNAHLDAPLAKRKDGSLDAYMAPVIKSKCMTQ